MKNLFLTILSALLVSPVVAQSKKLLLIGIDGCRPDALEAASTPNLDLIRDNGTYTYDAMNDGITISGPGWCSLLTGVWPAKHGVTDNTFVGFDAPNYPHLFQRIEEHDSTLNTVSVCQWNPINLFLASLVADQTVNVQDHSTYVETEAVDQLSSGDPDAIFLHFDDVDHAGHGTGFSPTNPDYLAAIETVDLAIGGVLTALYARPNYANEDWAIIVSTDHGGVGTSHGGTSFEHRNIFLFVSGDNIPNLEILADSVQVVTPPATNCLNDSVQLYFDGTAAVNTVQNPVFDFGTTQDFTVECRVRTTNSGDVAMVTDKDWDSGLNAGWVFSFNVNGGPWKVNVGDGVDRVDIEGGIIDDDLWHTLSATFDRSGSLTIYEDGVAVGSSSLAAIDDISTSFPISFGADGNGAYPFQGHIAEVRVFNGLVSGSDIDAWKCLPLTNAHSNYSDLIGYWRLADGNGTSVVADTSPTQADGVVSNAVWQSAQDTIFSYVYDYSNTPKQVDYLVSGLEHLCIPIDPAWNLDGQVVGTTCISTGVTQLDRERSMHVHPNPARDQVFIDSNEPREFRIVNALGITVYVGTAHTGNNAVDISFLHSGSYFICTDGIESQKLVVQP